MPSWFCTQITPIYCGVLQFETALVIKQPEAWLFENTLVFNCKTCAMLFHSSQRKCVDKPNIIYKNIVIVYNPNIPPCLRL
jgi:hypothetical protein